METRGSPPSEWETNLKEKFFQILSSREELTDSDDTSDPANSEEQDDAFENDVPSYRRLITPAFLNNPKIVKKTKELQATLARFSSLADDSSQPSSDSSGDNAENPSNTEEYGASISDAEKLQEENSRKVLDPESFLDRPLKTPMEVDETYEDLENVEEVSAESASGSCNQKVKNKKRHVTKAKKNLEVSQQARIVNRAKKPSMSINDGAGVQCFKEGEMRKRKRSENT